MSRRMPTLAAVVAVVAVAAATGSAAAQAKAPKPLVIEVTSVSLSLKTHDRPPKGASKGDTVVFADTLLNATRQFGKAKGRKVGSDRGTMTFTSKSSAVFHGTAVLPGGTLVLKGPVVSVTVGKGKDKGTRMLIPVTGGAGRYEGAHGLLLVGPGDKRSLNTYRLVLPAGGVAL